MESRNPDNSRVDRVSIDTELCWCLSKRIVAARKLLIMLQQGQLLR